MPHGSAPSHRVPAFFEKRPAVQLRHSPVLKYVPRGQRTVGKAVGIEVGIDVGASDGWGDGASDGWGDGSRVGPKDGNEVVGRLVGTKVGARVGTKVGARLGRLVGAHEGSQVGYTDGSVSQHGVPRSFPVATFQFAEAVLEYGVGSKLTERADTSAGRSSQN